MSNGVPADFELVDSISQMTKAGRGNPELAKMLRVVEDQKSASIAQEPELGELKRL